MGGRKSFITPVESSSSDGNPLRKYPDQSATLVAVVEGDVEVMGISQVNQQQ